MALWGLFWIWKLPLGHITSPTTEPEIPQRKIGKVTAVHGDMAIYNRTLNTHMQHSQRWGYPTSVLQESILDGYWNKLAIILQVLLQELKKEPDHRLQWLFWFDADTVLMNPNMPLETFLPPSNFTDTHILLGKDENGLNNGVFFIRVHQWSVNFLSAAIAYPLMKPSVDLFWHDQSAFSKLFEENDYFGRSVVYCPLRWFNAYMRSPDGERLNLDSPPHFQLHSGDLLVHFPGTHPGGLGETMGPYLAIAEEHREDWEPELESTGYIQETESFWKNLSSSSPFVQ